MRWSPAAASSHPSSPCHSRRHPIALATQAISEAGGDAAALSAAVSTLQQLMNEAISAGQDSVQEVGAVALKASTLGTLLGAIGAASEGAASSGSDDASKLIQVRATTPAWVSLSHRPAWHGMC